MIIAKDITLFRGNRKVLDSINFRVRKGEFVAIIGPNGAGKTTLIKILIGLIKPSKGTVEIDGAEPKDFIKKRRGVIGYLPQRAIVNWSMPLKVLDVVLIEKVRPFSLFRGYSKEDLEKAEYWLDVFGVKEKMNSYIKDLSGGEQQRVSLARCMFNDPEILVLDEPNTAVDAVYNVKIYETLKRLCDEKGITTIMVTHDIGAVTMYVDEVMCLNVKLHCHGSPSVINYSEMLRTVYGDGVNIIIHGEQCRNCTIGGVSKNDRTTH